MSRLKTSYGVVVIIGILLVSTAQFTYAESVTSSPSLWERIVSFFDFSSTPAATIASPTFLTKQATTTVAKPTTLTTATLQPSTPQNPVSTTSYLTRSEVQSLIDRAVSSALTKFKQTLSIQQGNTPYQSTTQPLDSPSYQSIAAVGQTMSTGSGLSELRSDIATGKVALSGSTIADSTLSGANITSGSADLTTLTTTGNANIGTDGGKIGIGGLNNPLDQISFYDNAAGDGFGFYGSDGSLMGNLWLNTGTTRNMFFSTPGVTGENTGGDNFIVMRFNGPSNKLFFGDTGTNSWVQGSHTLNFKAGEGSIGSTTTAPQMTLTTTGSLGIGTTSPQSALTVSSASAQFQISNGVSSMRIGNSGNSIYDIDFDATDNTSSRIIRFFRNANTTGVASIDILRADGTSGSAGRISSNSNSWLNLNSGNVGIGMTTPTYKLDVTGTAHFNSYVDAVNFVATSTTATSTFAGGLTVGTSKFIVDSTTGNVGIGTASPTEKLHISATQPEIVIQDSDSTGNGIVSGIVFKNSSGAQTAFFGDGSTGDSDFYLTNSNSGGIIFSSPGESMRILNSGRVGIGTSSPDGTLQISNNVGSIPSNGAFSVLTLDSTATAAVGTGPSIIFKGQTGNSTARYGFAAIQGAKASASAADYSGYLTFLTQNSGGSNALTEQMRIDGSGSVGIGTTSPSARLSVTGAGQGTTRAFAVADSTNLDRFVILDSGRIGVGTVLPTVLFDIRGTSASGFMRILSTDAATTDVGGSLSLGGNAGSTGATFATISGVKSSVGGDRGHMTFATNGNTGLTEKMRLDYLGNLGIGLTNPGYKLDVVGTASTSADSYFNGVRVGRGNSSIGQNTAVGYGTLNSDSSGDSNTAVGYLALYVNTIGGSNTAVGVSALSGNTEGNWNTANGMKSLQTNTIGSYNTAVGYQALSSNTTGSYNAAVGMYALNSNTTAQNNTALGYFSLGSNNTGTANLAAGKESLYSNVTGNYNTALGYQALYNAGKTVTSGNFVVGIAYTIVTAGNTDFVSEQGAANNNPGTTFTAAVVGTGTGTAASNTNDNLAIGYQTLGTLTTGTPNTAVGNQAGLALTTGIRNTLFGYAAGQSLTSGGTNIFIGHRAGVNSTVSNGNVVIGTNIGNGNDIGAGASSENVLIDTSTVLSGNSSYNVSIGASGNASMTDTTYNILIGRSTGGALTSGSNNVMVGGFAGAAVAATAGSNVMLGYYAGRYETGSNSFYINNQNQTDTAHDKTDSLLYGTFNTTAASQTLTINASTSIAQNLQVLGTGNSYFAGNVGVGTTNPQALLHVGNDYVSSATTFIKIAPSAATISSGQSFISWSRQSDSWTPASIGQRYPATVANYGGVLAFSTHHNDGVAATLPVERLTILADGNVGIGTTSPLVKLQVDYAAEDQTGGIILRNTSSHSNADVFMSYQNNAGAAGWSTGIDSSDDDFTIAYSPTSIATNQMFKIARTTGSVGLSSTTPAARLGITQSANTNAGGIWLAATDGDYRAMFMDTSGVLSFNGGDGTTLNTATLNAAGAWSNASDISYKNNIQDLGSKYGLDTVMKTTPRSYTMKGSNLPQVGFIAQELKPLIPEVVDGTDGSMGISYGNLVAVAFQAIKELNQKVTDLQTQMKDFVFDKLTAKIAYIDQIDVKKLNAVDANFSGVANFNNDARFAGNVCVDNVCVSKDKFKELLLNSGGVTYGSAADQMKGINPLDNQATPTVTTPAATTTTTIETTEATTTPIVIPVVETTEATSTTTIVPTPVETPTTPEPVPIPVQASEPVVTSTPPSTTETASTTNTTN